MADYSLLGSYRFDNGGFRGRVLYQKQRHNEIGQVVNMENNEEQYMHRQVKKNNICNNTAEMPFGDDALPELRTGTKRNLSPKKRRAPWFVIAISAAGLIIIIFAFIMEALANRDGNDPAGSGSRAVSEIQAELDELDWVEQVFLPVNPFSRPGIMLEPITGIVIHNIGNPGTTAMQNRNFFANLAITQQTHASSNFIVCLDGTILQCVPVDEMAYASNDRNIDTLSIEVCHPDDTGKFTDESYAAVIRLTAWLCIRYGLSSYDVIRHHDVRSNTTCPLYFVENEDAWEQFRVDVQSEIERLSS